MSRKIIIAGNWKLNLTSNEGSVLVESLKDAAEKVAESKEVVVFPTALGIFAATKAAHGSDVEVGGQNIYWEESGAFTGEVSASLLKSVDAKWVLIGHSERRQYFGETEETTNKKLKATLNAGLKPMLCIGETLEEREAGKLEEVLSTQVKGGLAGFKAEELSELVIAYEPVWAIGTGVVATTEQAQDAHAIVRSLLAECIGKEAADATRILYGGSVKAGNAAELMSQEDIDGALVGGASLTTEAFAGIIEA